MPCRFASASDACSSTICWRICWSMPSCFSICSLTLPPYAPRYIWICDWYARWNSATEIWRPSTLATVSPGEPLLSPVLPLPRNAGM